MSDQKQRAAGLYGIIVFKLIKGLLLLSIALGVYTLAGEDLRAAFEKLLQVFHLDPEKDFFVNLAEKIGRITPANIYWVAVGTGFYSLFSLVEGIGLIFRVSWAGWLAIGESLFFIPIEVFELNRHFTITLTVILIINIFICYYLFHNRKRLFHHAHFHLHRQTKGTPPPKEDDTHNKVCSCVH